MASGKFGLLLQSVQQCSDFLEYCETSALGYAIRRSPNQIWLKGVASEFGRIAKELQTWRAFAESRKNEQDAKHFEEEVQEDLKRCDYMLAILRDMWIWVEKLSPGATITAVERQGVYSEVQDSIDSVDRVIENIKLLDSFLDKGPPSALKLSNKIGNLDIRALFQSRIEQLHPDQRARSFSILHRGCVGFEKLDLFWDSILRPEGIYTTTDPAKTFDGILINPEHVDKARTTLEEFREAWLEVNYEGTETYPKDPPSLDSLPSMPIIACVLRACGKRELFNDFVSFGVTDAALDLSPEALLYMTEQAVGHRADAREIVAQFSRARQRPWDDGENLELTWSEPLPLIEVKALRERTNRPALGVFEVRDAWNPKQHYALKVLKPGTATQEQREELRNEINQLLQLGKKDHGHHFVRCVKTYERGSQQQEIGMLMTPVADGDLNMLLLTCCKSRKARERYRAYLLRACGCLTYSIAYLHNIAGVRHRDIKPHNVLFRDLDGKAGAEFLWADFGLATVFRDQCFSGTDNPGFGATPEYEAPEVDHQSRGLHTRASDIFALGCLLLEIVCVLSTRDNEERDTLSIRFLYWKDNTYYKHHLKGLAGEIRAMDKFFAFRKDTRMQRLLKLAQSMIIQNPNERPKIGKIVTQLWHDSPSEFFCTRCQDKMKTDLGRTPRHPDIFDHAPFPSV